VVNKQNHENGRVRFVKHVVTENVNDTVSVCKEVAHLEREEIVDGEINPEETFADETQELVLSEEGRRLSKQVVATLICQ
jgi:stress response protein YsnF